MAKRQGLNATLSYTRSGTRHVYRVRAGRLGYGVSMIATESEARTHRAYYPHRSATQRFTVQVLLKDWDERTDFTSWLADYAHWMLDPNVIHKSFPYLTVLVPSRNFTHHGIPLQGYEWGAHTGMMMFSPVIVFEAAFSPGQPNLPKVSSVIDKWSAFGSDKAIQFFYPFGTQLAADEVPQYYDQVQVPGATVPPSGTPGPATPSGSGSGLAPLPPES